MPIRPRGSVDVPLWRALATFRGATVLYAAALTAGNFRAYDHPVLAWVVTGAMAGWSLVTVTAYARARARRWPLVTADLLVTAACLLSSRWIVGLDGLDHSRPTLTVAWMACPVLAAAIIYGQIWGAVLAAAMGTADGTTRSSFSQSSLTGAVIMVLAAVAFGRLARLAYDMQQRLNRATAAEAATRERERLAREIHDSVLQAVTLVRRRVSELGAAGAEVGRLVEEQEATLRALVSAVSAEAADGDVADLRVSIAALACAGVAVSTPAEGVWLPAKTAADVVAAAGAALDNVRAHAGPHARAWVLLEDEPDAVTVTVRDDGLGFDGERLATAEAEGRFGVARSIKGRIRDAGGSVTIVSTPGSGTEVEMRVSRAAPPPRSAIRWGRVRR
jgi:signal transduction histidine kinase